MSSEKINVKFKLIQPGKSKLALVKAIKMVSGMGLKDSKDFVDSTDPNHYIYQGTNISSKVGILELSLTKSEIDEFRLNLENCDSIQFELDDKSKFRNRKLIEMGFYEKEELVNELVEEDLFEILRGGKDIDRIREILIERYSQIPENYIKEKLSI